MDKQETTREKIKQLDEIFRMLLLIITIMLSVEFGEVNLGFILAPLIVWMLGHVVFKYEDWEISLKLFAWLLASFIALVIVIKGVSCLSELNINLRIASFIFSLIPTALITRWLTNTLDEENINMIRKRL